MMVARRTRGRASANLQGRKPREVWRDGASDAMGISAAAFCRRRADRLFWNLSERCWVWSADRDRQNRRRATKIESRDGYPGRCEGEHGGRLEPAQHKCSTG